MMSVSSADTVYSMGAFAPGQRLRRLAESGVEPVTRFDDTYGNAKTYSDSEFAGFGLVMAPPPAAVTATYCFPSLPS